MNDVGAVVRLLIDAGAEFILIGGAAANVHGSARVTFDVDIVYRRTRENIDRIAGALAPHHPYLRGAPEGLPFRLDPPTILAGLNFTLVTDLGPVVMLGWITGGGSYDDLLPGTILVRAFDRDIRCLSLGQLIEAKIAAGRTKDFESIAELEALREERAGGEEGS